LIRSPTDFENRGVTIDDGDRVDGRVDDCAHLREVLGERGLVWAAAVMSRVMKTARVGGPSGSRSARPRVSSVISWPSA